MTADPQAPDLEFEKWFEEFYPQLKKILSEDDYITIYRAARNGFRAGKRSIKASDLLPTFEQSWHYVHQKNYLKTGGYLSAIACGHDDARDFIRDFINQKLAEK